MDDSHQEVVQGSKPSLFPVLGEKHHPIATALSRPELRGRRSIFDQKQGPKFPKTLSDRKAFRNPPQKQETRVPTTCAFMKKDVKARSDETTEIDCNYTSFGDCR